ncbi:MAG TPA: FtsX-like permease family protein [Xanthobacteraceae bacterium]|nr:FtsX-like permease family protein [Xanthobacteraceae bacterium]
MTRSALRFALRELRAGVRGFLVFIACIALGVAAIAGVNSFSESLSDGLAREGRVILGADVAFSLIQREAGTEERAFLASRGTLSVAATMRAMARTEKGESALVEIKAVDAAYPLYGAVALDRDMPLGAAIEERDGVFGAAADPALLTRLGLAPGARVTVGSATIELRVVLQSEPDKLAGGIAFGPRLIISDAALRATGLLQPGALVRWHHRLRLADGSDRGVAAVVAAARAQFPEAGWEVRTRSNASPQLERNVERFTQYLTLVGLTALLIGGVGVANAVKSHLDRKREVIATLKTLGATGGRVFVIYFLQVLMLALVGAAVGVAIGAALPFVVAALFGTLIPLPVAPTVHPGELALALGYGLLTAAAFAIWPLGRAHDVPVSALFRDAVAPERRWPRKRYMIAAAAVVLTLAALSVLLAYDRRIAAIFVAVAAVAFAALWAVAELLMRLARRVPRPRSTALRLAIANIHRPGALTPTVVLSLGLGLALLVSVVEIDGNLRRQFLAALPENSPSFYFVDLQAAEAERFEAFVRARAPQAELERVPMLRGRVVAARGVPAEQLRPAPSAAWVLQSDRGITYAAEMPRGSRLVEGEWWGADYRGPPLISMEKKVADGLSLKLGDSVTVNVLGRNISARIANFRSVDWQSLGINFVFVFSPGAFEGAPQTEIATLAFPGGAVVNEDALIKAVAEAFPGVTTVRVKDALEAVGGIVSNLVIAVRSASLIALFSAALVLGGALAAGHRHRVYDAVILKTLGATRPWLVAAYGLEYLLLGSATAVFGVAAGGAAAWLVVTELMMLPFTWLPAPALLAAFGALVVTLSFGLLGTFVALGHKPATVLRNL